MTLSFVRIPYTCTTCIWNRTKDCIMQHHRREGRLLMRPFIDNIKVNIVEKFSKLFTGADSVMIFDAPNAKVLKYGNAIHRDMDVVYF